MPFGFSYSAMARASKKALEREETAKAAFLAAKTGFEADEKQQTLKPGGTHTIALLTPNIHLTAYTYGTLNRWVKSNHEGWRLKRRQATSQECTLHRAYNRGKSYFVDAVYEAPDEHKKKRLAKAAEQRADKKAKLAARRDPSTMFGKLGSDLQVAVLRFVQDDVPRLEALLDTPYQAVAARDEFWEARLQDLLEDKFDGAFADIGDGIVALSRRPKNSTQFRAWYNECMSVEDSYMVLDSVGDSSDTIDQANEFASAAHSQPPQRQIRWLVENVPLREYYLQAKQFADAGEYAMRVQICEDTNRCIGCFEKFHSCTC